MNPIQKAANDFEASAIDACMKDPAYAARVESGEWCAACDMRKPCLCDERAAVRKMREFYETNRRTPFRSEPKLIGSWGVDMDGLMTELWKIATAAYRRR